MKRKNIVLSTDGLFSNGTKYKEVEAEIFGPLAVHRTTHNQKRWTVTHIATGFAVKTDIRGKEPARDLARSLRLLDCWDFVAPPEVKNIPKAKLKKIHALRNAL